MGNNDNFVSLNFSEVVKQYNERQQEVASQVKALASNASSATPGKFLLVQFGMSQITQIGDSISNLISQVNSCINNAVRNQKAG